MELIIDIGNSYIKCAICNNGKFNNFNIYKNDSSFNLNKYKKEHFTVAVISSVVKKSKSLVIKEIKKISKVKIVDIFNLKKNIKIDVNEKIDAIGSDLFADLIATKKLYKGPAVIFDIGTVSKVLALDKNNTFIGASFFPGLEMMSKSLNLGTDALPLIKLKYPKVVIAKNTSDCISSGVIHSIKYAINGFINDYKKELGKNIKVIFTGGGSTIFKKVFNKYIFNEYLTLLGIYFIYKENK